MNESEYIESRQPDYMRPVTETPLTDAAFAEYPVLDTQRGGDAITIQAARKIETSLRAQLAETQEKLKEAEKAHDQLTERYKTTHDHWIAAEERWKQVQQTLIRVQAEYAEREDFQPDLTLMEEVREALAMVEQDHLFPFTVDHDVLLPKVQQLLTRLNPRKD